MTNSVENLSNTHSCNQQNNRNAINSLSNDLSNTNLSDTNLTGVCAAKGFSASGIHCGIRKNKTKSDLALIFSEVPANAAAMYTQNKVKGAPIALTKQHLENGCAQAIICNSGNANTCNINGREVAEQTCQLLAETLNISKDNIIVASTGVIGKEISIDPFANSMQQLVDSLSYDGSTNAAKAIMTTDTSTKEVDEVFVLGDVECHIGGIAKGSGMIHPNMATMLAFITTDAAISKEMLHKALKTCVDITFNMISIDGDTSTNDMVAIMANGMAKNTEITSEGKDYNTFISALATVCATLAKKIVADGEGATKLIECHVCGAISDTAAKKIAKGIVSSDLVKTAMFGSDANWGRIICAIGYSDEDVDVNRIDIGFASNAGKIDVCKNGLSLNFSEEDAKKILLENEITIEIELNSNNGEATAWGCDLSYDYVRINGEYRT